MIAEKNKHGGQLGKMIEPVVVDLVSNWPLFAEKALEPLEKDNGMLLLSGSVRG
jgi:urea transport system substrate-binding protein